MIISRFPHTTNKAACALLFATCAALAAFIVNTGPLAAAPIEFANEDPEIEMWFYPSSTSNGTGSVRDRGSTFSSYSSVEGFPPVTGGGIDPIQRGIIVVATDTSEVVPQLADPSRYRIDSLRITLTTMNSIGSGVGVHDNTPDDHVAVANGNDTDAGNPIEMWAVGFGGSYETFGFHGESAPEYFNSGDRRWPISGGSFTGPYQIFAADSLGNDVSNAATGGYSATAAGNTTAPFSSEPLAVGQIYDPLGQPVAAGTSYGAGTKFVFEPDLCDENTVTYLQNSLAAGHLGFTFASLHQPNGHDGDVFYPDFYLDNNPSGPNAFGDAPLIELTVSILDESPSVGDYNVDGTVNLDDYQTWTSSFGDITCACHGADGNGNGAVDAADYVVWRKLTAPSELIAAAAAVPEPNPIAALITSFLVCAVALRRQDLSRTNVDGGSP